MAWLGLSVRCKTLQDSGTSVKQWRVEESECEELSWAQPVKSLVPALACDCGQAESCALVSSAATAGFKTAAARLGLHPTFRSFLAAASWWELRESKSWALPVEKKHKDTVDTGVARSFLSPTIPSVSVSARRVVLCCLVFVCLTPAAGSSRFDLLGAKSRLVSAVWAVALCSSFYTLLHLATSNLVFCVLLRASIPSSRSLHSQLTAV